MNELTKIEKESMPLARPAPSVADMLQAVIAGGVTQDSVGALEKLAALHERMEEKKARGEYGAALAALQKECQNVIASKDVDGKFRYAPFLDIWNAVRPAVERNNFTLQWQQENVGDRVTVTLLLAHFGHVEKFPYTLRVGSGAPGMPAAVQAPIIDTQTGSRAKRLLLINALNIVVDAVSDASDVGDGSLASDEETDALCKRLLALTDDPAAQRRFLTLAGVDAWNKIPRAVMPILERFMRDKERLASQKKGAA
jgi:hypothetical protein